MRKKQAEELEEKVLDVNANMRGTLSFEDPVNLKINGQFEGKLVTKGTLTISETAVVKAEIEGDIINIAGKVEGNIKAHKELRLKRPAQVKGDIATPILGVEPGSVFEGSCRMSLRSEGGANNRMSVEQVASYLNLGAAEVLGLADSGKLPGRKEGGRWMFEKGEIDVWLARQK